MLDNKFSKLFQSTEETDRPEVSQINGSIPDWLNGTFLRTGPGKWDFIDFTMNHLLDGFALLSKFTLNSETQTVSFEKKFLQSDAYKRGSAAQKPVITEFGSRAYPDPNQSFLSRMLTACLPIELTDNDSINIFQLGSKLFATSETCYFRQINSCNLDTGGKFDVNKCFGVNIASAHPLTDEMGTTWNIGFSVLRGLKYHILKIFPISNETTTITSNDLAKQSKIVATIPSSWTGLLSYNHSFGMTKNYIIFIEQPHVMNIGKAAKTYLKGNPCYKDWVEWRPELKNRFYIIEKSTGKVLKTVCQAKNNFFFLHVINAYEEDNQIVIDLNCYKDSSFFDDTYLAKLRAGDVDCCSKACGQRFVIPIISNIAVVQENIDLVAVKSNAVAIREGDFIILYPEVITEPGFEMPILNKKYKGIKNSYFYASGGFGSSQFLNSISKFNARNKKTLAWKGTEFQFPGEPQFISNPKEISEDDGVIISAVTDTDNNDFLLILDAKSMTEIGRAQFRTNICLALHGIFLSQ